MKKLVALLIVAVMLITFAPFVSAEDKMLSFNSDGTFRIMQINDFQDTDKTNGDSLRFLEIILDKYKPDLVVLVGDQLASDFKPEKVTEERIKTSLVNQLKPLADRNIPFLFTFGNHDREYWAVFNINKQAEFYREYPNCYANIEGCDGGTYNTLIYSSDKSKPGLNIYMMDTNYWNSDVNQNGVSEKQIQWYIEKSNELAELNGGSPMPSLVFQHIPVKEIYQFLKKTSSITPNAHKGRYTDDYYILDKNADLVGDLNIMGETPCSENPSVNTGQYQAWVKQGDIIGAYFGHDHMNTFVGRTNEGIVMGYNGALGFAAYGDSVERYARIYDFNENDVANYKMKTICYTDEIAEYENCNCLCHKDGFKGFIWKILNAFYKLFKLNSICDCGVKHY